MSNDILKIDGQLMVRVDITKKGYPAVWENGGGLSNTGHSFCIAKADGTKKNALFVRTGGHLACSDHALFIVNKNDYICKVWRHRGDYEVTVYKVLDEKPVGNKNYHDDKFLPVQVCHEWSNGEWDVDPDMSLESFIQAAKDKTCDYHCRSMYWGNIVKKQSN